MDSMFIVVIRWLSGSHHVMITCERCGVTIHALDADKDISDLKNVMLHHRVYTCPDTRIADERTPCRHDYVVWSSSIDRDTRENYERHGTCRYCGAKAPEDVTADLIIEDPDRRAQIDNDNDERSTVDDEPINDGGER